MKISDNGSPRRIRIDLYTPAETAIRNAVLAVEEAGCHPFLTEAVNLLQQAKEKVADYVELPTTNADWEAWKAANQPVLDVPTTQLGVK
jgi:hypothetical protein